MDAVKFLDLLEDMGGTFFTGVPDSLLSPFIDSVVERYAVPSERHIVAANEGAAVGIAAGHYLATKKPAVVYMQNSGLGNAVNPITSLLHEKVYSIPVIFVIGWRGEPGTKDEPQHVFQGEKTLELLDCLEIPYAVIGKETADLSAITDDFKKHLNNGRSVAFVIQKDAIQSSTKIDYTSNNLLSREEVLKIILSASLATTHGRTNIPNTPDTDIFVCTTGKLSREVFEIRQSQGVGHGNDFLTVGSMGHSLMIAYGIALAKPKRRVFCLDGDGAALMHLGSLAVVGVNKPANLIHVVINNGAHETVGGLPTVCTHLNLSEAAKIYGYRKSLRVINPADLEEAIKCINTEKNADETGGPIFIEVLCNLGSRKDLGRPTTSPIENKNALMSTLAEDCN